MGSLSSLAEWTTAATPIAEISGDAEPYLARVGEVEFLSDGRLLVEDNQSDELRLFDATGSLQRLLGGQGEGPGEFQNLTELTVVADTIYAYDRRLYRITAFAPSGTLLFTAPLGRDAGGRGDLLLDAFALGADRHVLHMLGSRDTVPSEPMPRRDTRRRVLYVVSAGGDSMGGIQDFASTYSAEFESGDASVPFAPTPIVATARGIVVHGDAQSYQLVVADEDLNPIRLVRWLSEWTTELTEAEVAEAYDSVASSMGELAEQRPDLAENLLEAMFAPSVLRGERPVLSAALLAPDGAIWVRLFQANTKPWSEETLWHVMDTTGTPQARIRLPPRSKLAAVGRNRVALIEIDDLDVQHVRVYEIVQP